MRQNQVTKPIPNRVCYIYSRLYWELVLWLGFVSWQQVTYTCMPDQLLWIQWICSMDFTAVMLWNKHILAALLSDLYRITDRIFLFMPIDANRSKMCVLSNYCMPVIWLLHQRHSLCYEKEAQNQTWLFLGMSHLQLTIPLMSLLLLLWSWSSAFQD